MNTIYYIKENDQYIEMTRDEYEAKLNNDPTFEKRRFMRCEGALVEVPERIYQEEEKELQRVKYLRRLDVKYNLISYDRWDTGNLTGEELIHDIDAIGTEDMALNNFLVSKMREVIDSLSDEDRELVKALYISCMSEREVALSLGVTKAAIHRRKNRMISRIKKIYFN